MMAACSTVRTSEGREMAHEIRDVTTGTAVAVADRSTHIQAQTGVVTALVDDISPEGVPRVVLAGESGARSAASTMHFATAAAASEALLGQTVLVLVGGDIPVILGLVRERLWAQRGDDTASEVQVVLPVGQAMQVRADKRRVELEAADEIRLTCGKSALVLRRDGTVIVRGVKIVSRASETHRIMGATVAIN
jgi:hypothetical protein